MSPPPSVSLSAPVSISFAHCHLPNIGCSPRWAFSASLLDCKHPKQCWACSILNDNHKMNRIISKLVVAISNHTLGSLAFLHILKGRTPLEHQ